MWVNEILPPRVRLSWLLITTRLSIISLAGIARTLVAVGRSNDIDMFFTTAAAAPRNTWTSSPSPGGGPAGLAAGAGALAAPLPEADGAAGAAGGGGVGAGAGGGGAGAGVAGFTAAGASTAGSGL